MREVTIYYADDGTRFDDEDECCAYEAKCKWKNLIDSHNIEVYDKFGNVAQDFNKTHYINFKDEQALEGFRFYAGEYALYYGLSELSQEVDNDFYVGHWAYDGSNSEWVSLEALDAYVKRIKGEMGW